MQKVTFNAKVNMPKMIKGETDPRALEEARAKTTIQISIKGTFTADEAGVLELLLKSWHQDGKKASLS